MHYVGANLGENGVKIGDTLIGYWPPTKGFFRNYQVPDVCAKFHQNPLKIATVRAQTDKQTHTHTHRQRWHGWSYNLSYAML